MEKTGRKDFFQNSFQNFPVKGERAYVDVITVSYIMVMFF